jgi:hypothetical protein
MSKAPVRDKIKSVITEAQKVESALQQQKQRTGASEAMIKKEFDLFKYRDVLPLVNQTVLRMMPNIQNSPEQADLYNAFNSGDIGRVKAIARDQRKQIFVTGLSVYYSLDLPTSRFGTAAFDRASEGRPAAGGRGGGKGEMSGEEYMRMLSGGRYKSPTSRGGRGATAARTTPGRVAPGETQQPTEAKGFVVSVVGYSPYKEIMELFDPPGAKDDPNKWGIVTRLMNLDRFFDGNSPFELYERTSSENFDLKTGEVDLSSDMPVGIGVRKAGDASDAADALIDPMTKEIISKTEVVDEAGKKVKDRTGNQVYKTNDHWFVLNMKLKWKNAPATATEAGAAGGVSPQPPPSEPSPAPRAPAPRGGSSKPERKERVKAPDI